jgi:PTH1 family peptidyl-tRNA hydrolase
MIKLLVGLGNPGAEYEDTRHNAGFWWVDRAARELKVSLVPEKPWFGLAARANAPAGPVWLLEPMTYMNLSGKAVGALARFYKIAPAEILVVHDELDLPAGEKRMKLGGSHAGHNGLKDIHAALGTADYWRLRIGIGHPGTRAEVVNWVLRKPPAAERDAIHAAIDESLACLPLLLAGEMERATMKINARPKPPKAPKPPPPEQTAAGDTAP